MVRLLFKDRLPVLNTIAFMSYFYYGAKKLLKATLLFYSKLSVLALLCQWCFQEQCIVNWFCPSSLM